ncbi:tetratricopeptide repeat protein [Derxia gummosa]|uniref:Tetratricopeptide repeat protein n=1 Tax=Derxia gummosa DSM 723 TaxID=1121388 RepID=A0A8B6X9W7_9BURK|nr:tetratricopeptide repeat protein [Derxia gummosa]
MTTFFALAAALSVAALLAVLWPLVGPLPRRVAAAGGAGKAADGVATPDAPEAASAVGHATPTTNAPVTPAHRRLAGALVLLLPLLAAGLYAVTGAPSVLRAIAADDDSLDRLEAATRAEPASVEAWRRLARGHEHRGDFERAVTAWKRAVDLAPNDADLLLDYAVTLGMARGAKLDGEPEALIERAIELAPDHVQALALSGSVRFERGDYAGAIAQWERVLAQVPADAEVAQSIRAGIDKARALEQARR